MTRLPAPAYWLPLAAAVFVAATDTPAQEAKAPPARPAEVKMTALALTAEALKNITAAEKKYNGKIVELTGPVQFANKILNENGFSLQGAKSGAMDFTGLFVVCVVKPKTLGKVWELGSGQEVRATGKITVTKLCVYLTDCEFEPLGKCPTPRVTATDLTAEMLKDADAQKKYQTPTGFSKEIVVSGTVQAVEKDQFGYLTKLKGTGGVTVDCATSKAESAALKAGDRVTIKGDFADYEANKKRVLVNTSFVLTKP